MNARQVFVAILLAAFAIIGGGFYPQAQVNGKLIWAFDFNKNLSAAQSFYQKNVNYQDALAGESSYKFLEKNMAAAVLQNLIEESVISANVQNIPGGSRLLDFKIAQITKKIDGEARDQNIGAIYGWDFKTFKKRIIEPEARREILANFIIQKGQDFDRWFLERKREAQVRIFNLGFTWDGNQGRVLAK